MNTTTDTQKMQAAFESSHFYFSGEGPAEREANWRVWREAWGAAAEAERAECARLCKEHEARLRRAQFVAKADSVATVCDDIEQRGHKQPNTTIQRAGTGPLE